LVKNNLGDSIETFLSMKLLASAVKSQNQSKQQSFQVIPNPDSDKVSISFNQTLQGVVQIYITDVNGKIITMENVQQNLEKGNRIFSFDVGGLSNGLYFLKLIGQQEVFTHKLLVKH
jgi:hypothetical protein